MVFLLQHTSEEHSEKLKRETFKACKKKKETLSAVISLQRSLPWDARERRAKICKGAGNASASHGCLKLMAVKTGEGDLAAVYQRDLFHPHLAAGGSASLLCPYLRAEPSTG